MIAMLDPRPIALDLASAQRIIAVAQGSIDKREARHDFALSMVIW